MNNSKSSLNNPTLLILSGLMVLLLIVLIVFSINKINTISDQIEIETAKLDEDKDTYEKLKQLDLLRPELESANRVLVKQIPVEPSEHDLIEYIYSLSENNKNNFIEIEFKNRQEKEDIFEMPFSMNINGKYESMIKLLNSIANGERLIRIDEIQIESVDNVKGLINTSITANAFYK